MLRKRIYSDLHPETLQENAKIHIGKRAIPAQDANTMLIEYRSLHRSLERTNYVQR